MPNGFFSVLFLRMIKIMRRCSISECKLYGKHKVLLIQFSYWKFGKETIYWFVGIPRPHR